MNGLFALRSMSPRLPVCASCARQAIMAGQQQQRGKKTTSRKPKTLLVRLLKPIRSYGDKGSLLAIPPGQMRNIWFPHSMADYATPAETAAVKRGEIVPSRDNAFGFDRLADHNGVFVEPKTEKARKALADWDARVVEAKQSLADRRTAGSAEPQKALTPALQQDKPDEGAAAVVVNKLKLDPKRTVELLRWLLPATIDFYRQPVLPATTPVAIEAAAKIAEKTMQESSPHVQNTVPSAQGLDDATDPQDTRIPIYGSVTAQDVAEAVRALLAYNNEASRVVLSEKDIRFVSEAVAPPGAAADAKLRPVADSGRVKHLGEYFVGLKPEGQKSVRRIVRVISVEPEKAVK